MKEALRSLKMATWLGWQIESNWTDPFLFGIYTIAKPVSGALILPARNAPDAPEALAFVRSIRFLR